MNPILHQFGGDYLPILVTALIAGHVGFLSAALLAGRKLRHVRNRTWAEAERLHRARAIQDLRDNMPRH